MGSNCVCEYGSGRPGVSGHSDHCLKVQGYPARIAELETELKCVEAELGAAKRLITELRDAQRWIPVCEKLPRPDDKVLALDITGGQSVFYGEWVAHNTEIYSHWMPLPIPPTEPSNES